MKFTQGYRMIIQANQVDFLFSKINLTTDWMDCSQLLQIVNKVQICQYNSKWQPDEDKTISEEAPMQVPLNPSNQLKFNWKMLFDDVLRLASLTLLCYSLHHNIIIIIDSFIIIIIIIIIITTIIIIDIIILKTHKK